MQKESDKVYFEQEHLLGTSPAQIDIVIIKKDPDYQIKKNIGQIFRTYNIIEYKSPEDYLSVDDFYKAYGYVCFYKSDTGRENFIPITELTLTLVCCRCPSRLFQHWKEDRQRSILRLDRGIYLLEEYPIPVQLIITSELSDEENLWLRNLTNRLTPAAAERLLREYGKHRKDQLYESVMDIIMRANQKTFQEVKDMCQALMELMKDELDDSRRQGIALGLEQGMEQGLEQGILAAVQICRNLNIPETDILAQLQKEYQLSKDAAKLWIRRSDEHAKRGDLH